ncbi:hypothetical protein [Proteiniphilum sp. UBA5384]|uniref:hypothetical protein n=1 Tax=Proteiniphilum sp. UBA5384 TaxID=1947279 RepID=UPI0025F17E32|nr:hypothetical protein [Proteiniphilum sp. UBA5384]
MCYLSKQPAPTRLVEDHSPDKYDHVESDLNTWHRYLPGISKGKRSSLRRRSMV